MSRSNQRSLPFGLISTILFGAVGCSHPDVTESDLATAIVQQKVGTWTFAAEEPREFVIRSQTKTGTSNDVVATVSTRDTQGMDECSGDVRMTFKWTGRWSFEAISASGTTGFSCRPTEARRQKERTEAESKARAEGARQAREEAERKAKEDAARKAKEDAEHPPTDPTPPDPPVAATYKFDLGDSVKCLMWDKNSGWYGTVEDKRDDRYRVKVTSVVAKGFLSTGVKADTCSGNVFLGYNDAGTYIWVPKYCVE